MAFAGAAVAGEIVPITASGVVEFNGITSGMLGMVNEDDAVELTFEVDAGDFSDNPNFPTRSYPIDPASFSLAFGESITMGLQSPFPVGETPLFVIRNNDPAVDGFFVATSPSFPNGVPLNQTGVFGQFRVDFLVTYGGATLSSFDILDATGTYDLAGLKVFNWVVLDGPFKPLGMIFEELTIGTPCPADLDGDGAIGLGDLGVVLAAFGVSAAGDIDGDGDTDLSDLGVILALFGQSCP
jgi:hypothetical protein